MDNIFESMQIIPPWDDDVLFEEFITEYFNDLNNTKSYDRFGRSGQKQDGLDIYSIEEKTVIQCKLKQLRLNNDNKIRDELINELNSDFESFTAYNSKNNLSYNKFIFTSTFHTDTHIITECTKLSNEKITVEYWSWDRLLRNIPSKTRDRYYKDFINHFGRYFNQSDLDFPESTENLEFKIDRDKHIVDQTYDYLEHLYREVNFLPIHLLKNAYPIKAFESFYSQYSSFTLSTDNTELFELLSSLEFTNEGARIGGRKYIKGVKGLRHKIEFGSSLILR